MQRGALIAQVHFVAREQRRAEIEIVARDSAEATALRGELSAWFTAHRADRRPYRRLARSQAGRVAVPHNDAS